MGEEKSRFDGSNYDVLQTNKDNDKIKWENSLLHAKILD